MEAVADGLWQLRGRPPHAINVYLAGDVLVDAARRASGSCASCAAGRCTRTR